MHGLQYLLLTVSGSRAKSINFNTPLTKSLCTLKFETEYYEWTSKYIIMALRWKKLKVY